MGWWVVVVVKVEARAGADDAAAGVWPGGPKGRRVDVLLAEK